MNKYSVKKYTQNDYKTWNDFIDQAKNATFLFHRDFMEYHKDRFQDYSLLVFEDKKLVAVLPANRDGDTIHSHQGLTYGGLIYKETLRLTGVIEIFKAVLFFLNENKIKTFYYKSLPSIYHLKPAEEILYALFLAETKLIRRDSLSVIDLSKSFLITSGRKEGVKKGIKSDLVIIETNDLDSFWEKILIPNLLIKYNAKPVHSAIEIKKLKLLFPENIRQFNVYFNKEIVAGATFFETKTVAHCQYISKNEKGQNLGSLDFLFEYLIKNVFKEKKYFDFGISNENQGKKLNSGLSFWKESFGASTIIQDFYEIETSNYEKFNNVFI